MNVVEMKTLCAKVVVLSPQNHVLLTIFIYVKKRRLQSNFREACIKLKKNLKSFLFLFLATREAVALLTNDLLMLGTSIRSFRHLKHQNLSTGDDSICSSGIFFLVSLLATREAVALLANDLIMSGTSTRLFRHLEHQNPSIISEDTGE